MSQVAPLLSSTVDDFRLRRCSRESRRSSPAAGAPSPTLANPYSYATAGQHPCFTRPREAGRRSPRACPSAGFGVSPSEQEQQRQGSFVCVCVVGSEAGVRAASPCPVQTSWRDDSAGSRRAPRRIVARAPGARAGLVLGRDRERKRERKRASRCVEVAALGQRARRRDAGAPARAAGAVIKLRAAVCGRLGRLR